MMLIALLIVLPFVAQAFNLLSSDVGYTSVRPRSLHMQQDPLLLRAARGEKVERVPVWMMRQAGRHMKVYRDLVQKHKTFRDRSENADVATEIR